MSDLKNPKLIYLKGILFVVCGVVAAGLLVVEFSSMREITLLLVSIWCFCRAYYFAFYVIEHYVDDDYKFAGLWSFACYLMSANNNKSKEE
ncbi:MAG: hypothetical protein AB8B55_07200 [Mariniblastus sp.]